MLLNVNRSHSKIVNEEKIGELMKKIRPVILGILVTALLSVSAARAQEPVLGDYSGSDQNGETCTVSVSKAPLFRSRCDGSKPSKVDTVTAEVTFKSIQTVKNLEEGGCGILDFGSPEMTSDPALGVATPAGGSRYSRLDGPPFINAGSFLQVIFNIEGLPVGAVSAVQKLFGTYSRNLCRIK